MTDTVASQPSAPAATSAPAVGETSTQAPAETNGTPPATADTSAKPAPQTAAQDDADDDQEGTPKRPTRRDREKRARELLLAENDELRRQLGAGARPKQDATAKPDATEDQPPKEADFNGDYLAFERALNAFNVKQAAREAVRAEAERDRTERQAARDAEVARERFLAHQDRADELRERVPDFDDTIKGAAGIKLRPEVVDEILGSEKSALIQYHLAKNPDKARELNSLTGKELARAVGRLEGAVRLPPAKKATDATPPVQPLSGAVAPSFDPAKAEMDEYAAQYAERKKRQAARA